MPGFFCSGGKLKVDVAIQPFYFELKGNLKIEKMVSLCISIITPLSTFRKYEPSALLILSMTNKLPL